MLGTAEEHNQQETRNGILRDYTLEFVNQLYGGRGMGQSTCQEIPLAMQKRRGRVGGRKEGDTLLISGVCRRRWKVRDSSDKY
jgi:hypothetical protein